MSQDLEQLKAKLGALREVPALKHRLYRSLSWLERADTEDDADARCVFLWIAFNAAYAIDRKAEGGQATERQQRRRYFGKVVPLDTENRIHSLAVGGLRDSIRDLVGNPYVFRGFWDCLTEETFDWKAWPKREQFDEGVETVERLLRPEPTRGTEAQPGDSTRPTEPDVQETLDVLFDRLYVLRIQLMHGCATQNGSLNRRQVEAGDEVLRAFVPMFLNIMIDNLWEDWGAVSFPVRDDIREDWAYRVR